MVIIILQRLFSKRYPVQAEQLKGFESQCFNDEYPGNIVWFEQGGLEKGRYLPIASPNEYDNLMFDTKTKKYVVVDSEELEPEELHGGVKIGLIYINYDNNTEIIF